MPLPNFYTLTNGLNAVLCLVMILFVLLKRKNEKVHKLYLWWMLCFLLWTSLYFVWGACQNKESALFWFKLLVYPTCFIHIAYFHFILAFSKSPPGRYKRVLIFGYLLCLALAAINYHGGFYDVNNIRPKYSFAYWPHAAPLLSLFILAQLVYVTLSFYVLLKATLDDVSESKTRLKLFTIVSVLGWVGGITNWFGWYDFPPIPPAGNILVMIYLIATFYLIFKHNLLELNIAIQKTFLYTVLTLFVTLTYTLFILASERWFQNYVGYHSMFVTLLAGITIALLFNPVRSGLTGLLDKYFFGKNIAQLSSENLRMMIELQKQYQMKAVATLAAGMAHEIKNPLTSLKTFASYLPEKYQDEEFRQSFSRIVIDEVDRVNNIIQQLLEFSKPQEPVLKPNRVTAVLQETLELLSSNLSKSHVRVVERFEADPPCLIDKNQLKQAFLNVLLNAIQAMPDGGVLTLSVRAAGKGRLAVFISDTGHGISEEKLSHIFEPFFTTKGDGTGLGLSIVQSIIEKHGGKIEVSSEEGKGTEFRIYLRINAPA